METGMKPPEKRAADMKPPEKRETGMKPKTPCEGRDLAPCLE